MTECVKVQVEDMQHKILYAKTPFEQIQIFCEMAEDYQGDFQFPEMKKFLTMDFKNVCAFLRSKYLREQGEQILRPYYFYKIGSDCDDAFCFMVALWLAAGVPKSDIYVCEAKESETDKNYCHIFAALKDPKSGKMIWFDNLPGTEFNRLDYPLSRVRVTPLTDYI